MKITQLHGWYKTTEDNVIFIEKSMGKLMGKHGEYILRKHIPHRIENRLLVGNGVSVSVGVERHLRLVKE